MYFVNKDQLNAKLKYIQQLTEQYEENKHNHFAFERIAQMLIESSVDIGNMIIDGFILRDPGNYKDVIDINQTVDVRKQFVHYYDELDTANLMTLFDNALPFYRQFIQEVIQFVESENVPITAFGKKGD